jgi:hypothetical protein
MKMMFNIAPFISKTIAAFEINVIQEINNFDYTQARLTNVFFFFFFCHIDRLDTRAQVKVSLFIIQIKRLFNNLFGLSAILTQSCEKTIIT